MYVWLWRHLPGPLVLRLLQVVILFAVATALLMLLVFPRLEPLLPFTDVTVDPSPSPTPTVTATVGS